MAEGDGVGTGVALSSAAATVPFAAGVSLGTGSALPMPRRPLRPLSWRLPRVECLGEAADDGEFALADREAADGDFARGGVGSVGIVVGGVLVLVVIGDGGRQLGLLRLLGLDGLVVGAGIV